MCTCRGTLRFSFAWMNGMPDNELACVSCPRCKSECEREKERSISRSLLFPISVPRNLSLLYISKWRHFQAIYCGRWYGCDGAIVSLLSRPTSLIKFRGKSDAAVMIALTHALCALYYCIIVSRSIRYQWRIMSRSIYLTTGPLLSPLISIVPVQVKDSIGLYNGKLFLWTAMKV